MVPRGQPLIGIGYKYDARKVLYFIVAYNAESTQAGIPYLSNYTGQFSNVAISPVDCRLFMHKFFGSVNEVDSHNKSSQSGLYMYKFLVTQCG